jgi:hypothetical protein
VTGSDLAALKSGSLTNQFGDFAYTQYIDLPTGAWVNWTKPSDDIHDNDIPADYLILNQSRAYTYKLAFSPAVKSDNDANSRLKDLESKKITMLGKTYTIVKAEHPAKYSIQLTLMGGAVEDTLQEYTSKTYNIGGKEYKVEVVAIATSNGADAVKFKINGEITDVLYEGDTYVLTDGTEIGVKDLLQNEGTETGGADIVTFYLGAKKIVLDDTATNSSVDDGTVQVGSDTLANTFVQLTSSTDQGTSSGDDTTLDSIEVYYSPSQDLYLGAGEGLSSIADQTEGDTGNVFLNGFDLTYQGLQVGKTETIGFKPSGNNNYKIEFTNKAGQSISQNVVGYTSGDGVFLGSASGSTKRALVTSPTTEVNDEDYVLIGDGAEGGYGRILQYKGAQNADNYYKLRDIGTGETYDVTYNTAGVGTLVVDGFSSTITGTGDSSTYVNVSSAKNYIYTQYGAKLTFSASGTADAGVTLKSETTQNGVRYDQVGVMAYYDSGNSQLDINASSWTGIPPYQNFQHADDDYYNGYASGDYGTFWRYDKPTGNSQSKATFTYPDDQVTAAVFVTSGATSESSSGVDMTKTIVPIPVSASKLASEVSDIKAQNSIVVGGPCVNPAAATLMGNPANCAAGFEEGKAMIKLFEFDNGNVAMLVAGYSALDTRRATTVLAQYKQYADQLVGDEVVVTGTTLSDIKVGAPEVVTPPAATDNSTMGDNSTV